VKPVGERSNGCLMMSGKGGGKGVLCVGAIQRVM
jgi:hypothetical protein